MDGDRLVWWKRDVGARLTSLVLVAACLLLRHRPLPMMLEWAQRDALLNVGTIIWPLALLPWLLGRPGKRRTLWLLVGLIAGFWAMGHPLFGVIHGIPLPNIILLPRLVGALGAGWLLAYIWNGLANLRWAGVAKGIMPLLGLIALFAGVHPINVAVSLQPGNIRPGKLSFEVAETHELRADLLAAYTYGDVLVAVGHEEWLWRTPDGQATIRPGSFDPWRVQVHCDGQRLLIAEPQQGRIECYRYPDGALLWRRENLGELLDVAWTADYAWALNCPDFESGLIWPWPDDPQVVLHRLDLSTGQNVQVEVDPPEQRYWKHASSGPLAWLEANQEQAWVAGWCSLEQPVYEAPNFYTQAETDLPFVFRSAQGNLEQLSLLLPGGIPIHHDYLSPLSYYLQADQILDSMPSPDGASLMVRARSLRTGRQLWERRLAPILYGQSFQYSYPFRADGKLLLDDERGVLCLDESSGQELWHFAHSSRLRWAAALESDVVFGLADGSVVRMAKQGEPAWKYAAGSLTDLERLDLATGLLIVRETGITASAESVALLGSSAGSPVALSLADGSRQSLSENWLECDKFALAGEFVWQMRQFTYRPGPYNGDRSIYRLHGNSVTIRDLNLQRDGMLVRPGYLLVAEQIAGRTHLTMLRVAKK